MPASARGENTAPFPLKPALLFTFYGFPSFLHTAPMNTKHAKGATMKTPFEELAAKWPSSVVARTEINRFSGGTINARTLANYDSAGRGPAGRFRVGRKVCYRVADLCKWLEDRSSTVEGRRHDGGK